MKICKNCGSVLEERSTKRTPSQLKKPYYYSAYYLCPNCHRLYHDDKFKVVNAQTIPPYGGLMDKGQEKKQKSLPSSPFPLSSSYDVKIWTDGACVFNGTPKARAAWAFVSGETEIAGLVEGKQTNNVAEGLAIYYAIEWACERKFRKILIHTDSQISLFNLAKPASKVKMNREIFEDIEKIITENNLEVDYKKVLGHSGEPNNERVDKLANGLATKG